jgi:hypothetical protein
MTRKKIMSMKMNSQIFQLKLVELGPHNVFKVFIHIQVLPFPMAQLQRIGYLQQLQKLVLQQYQQREVDCGTPTNYQTFHSVVQKMKRNNRK